MLFGFTQPSLSPGKRDGPPVPKKYSPAASDRGNLNAQVPAFSSDGASDPLRMSRNELDGPRGGIPGSFPPMPPLKSTWSGKHVVDATEIRIDPAPASPTDDGAVDNRNQVHEQSDGGIVRINLSSLSQREAESPIFMAGMLIFGKWFCLL